MSIITGKIRNNTEAYIDLDGNVWQREKIARKENSRMSWDAVRNLCTEKGFYNKGDAEDYNNLARLIDCWEETSRDITTDMLQVVAEDILQHSNTYYEVETIMFELSQKCVRRFYSVAEH